MLSALNNIKNKKQKLIHNFGLNKLNILFNFNKSSFLSPQIAKSFSLNEPRVYKETNLKGYINYIRKHSFKVAKLDPLNLNINSPAEECNAQYWELGELEKIEEFPIDNSPSFNKSLLNRNITISDLEQYLKKLYLSTVGVEFEHIDDEEEKLWLYENYEEIMCKEDNNMELVNIFKILYPAELFEKFLSNKFPTFKRYSGEGANTLLAVLYSILAECSKKDSQVKNAILSMPHRGRLNVLPMILDYPVANLLTKIQGKRDMPREIEGIDDVVSHVAVSNQKLFCLDGSINNYKPIQISLLHNPSHLEAIYPMASGKAYAKVQDNNKETNSVMNITIHGDAAVSGQGVIYETLSFHKAPNCNLGGTLHIVTNNQIGYTTQAEFSRSSLNCTDIFKTYSIPIIHINGDDTQSLIKIGKLAYMYKQKFKKDFVINLLCWRKYGHNEIDEPMFTQPLMYKAIKNKKESVEILKNHLIEKNLITDEGVKSLEDKFNKILNEAYKVSQNLELKIDDVRNEKFKGNKSLTHKWKEMDFPQFCKRDDELVTGLKNVDEVKNILKASVTLPEGFQIHSRLNQYFVNNRLAQIEKEIIDWPSAEIAAFGSLLKDGYNVRISGQDVTRGTFSQRHIGLVHQGTNDVYFPFKDENNFKSEGRLEVNNSSLSEFAVMLFEYGYSLESPKNCVMWEAQFGDFVNGAQIAQDQFLASGEKKWMRQSGLILLLPHGYDGTGPEHSSSKVERFLQLVDSNGINPLFDSSKLPDHRKLNMSIVQPTRPSNYFHLLRRQMLRSYRKPLIVVTPKIGLKHSAYVSPLSEFTNDNKFSPIITDSYNNNLNDLSNINKVVFCSGQIYMELKKQTDSNIKENRKVDFITVRIEELAPFPDLSIMNLLCGKIGKDTEFYWVQEESMNAGCFTYVAPHLRRIMRNLGLNKKEINYIGRDAQVGANGCADDHKMEVMKLNREISKLI